MQTGNYDLLIEFLPILLIAFLIILPIILNFIGWYKNNAKLILAAAIIYIFGLNIPSSVLCFIGHNKLKKTAMDGK